jgi:signal transduction histidine kinase
MAERELTRVANIAQQTLGFVREPALPVPLEVGTVLDEVLHLHSQALGGKKVKVQTEYGQGLEIMGFPGELRQVFVNFIANAIDASLPGARLRVRVARAREWRNANRAGVRVTIADEGCGMSSETIAHLFEPFYTTKKDSGTGLGLWLSYSIVQKHGGAIRVRSRMQAKNRGTVFSIFLPAKIESAQAA